ncbi:MAG: DUF2975 domain-containing protein [Pseudomonadota bacterium]
MANSEDARAALARLRRLSGALRWTAYGAAASMAATLVALLLWPGWLEAVLAQSGRRGTFPAEAPLTGAQRAIASAVLIAVVGAGIAAVLSGARLFDLWRAGEVFTEASAQAVRRVGVRLLTFAGLALLATPVLSVALSWHAPPGERALAISIDGAMVLAALTGGLLAAVGQALRLGVEIERENRSFV